MTTIEAEKFIAKLEELGYKRYKQNFKSEEFAYWKSAHDHVDDDGDKIVKYTHGFLFYDHGKYPGVPKLDHWGVEPHMLVGNTFAEKMGLSRCDLAISLWRKDIDIQSFEKMCEDFFNLIVIPRTNG